MQNPGRVKKELRNSGRDEFPPFPDFLISKLSLGRQFPGAAPFWFMAQVGLALLTLSAGAGAAADWQQESPNVRSAAVSPTGGDKPGFTLMPPEQTGAFFTNVLAEERGLTNQIYLNGSGVALGDVDGDGWVDIYLCGTDSPNRLFRNLGNWKFEDITERAGVACAGQASTGAVFADVDGDGHLDLLVTGLGHGARLFLNDGHAHFREATAEAGLASTHASTSMALADIDGDGTLDLYLCNYRTSTFQDEPGIPFNVMATNGQVIIKTINGRPATAADRERYWVDPVARSIRENGEPDVLYRNDGHGKFTPISWTSGAFLDEDGQPSAVPRDWTLTAMFRDLNGDGWPDIYACGDNDSLDRIWINLGNGRFQAIPRLALRHTSMASMAVDFADINRDGYDDFFVSDMLMRGHALRNKLMPDRYRLPPPGLIDNRPQYTRNTLCLNRGDGTFAEIAQLAGIDATDWTWMPAFLDVDLDGYEDLLIVAGLERSLRDAETRRMIDRASAQQRLSKQDFVELRRKMPRLPSHNFVFRNRRDLTFEDTSAAWGFNSASVSQGMALADLDNDGALDLVINCQNANALIYRNHASAPRLGVRLKGNPPNTRGIGAKIKVLGGPVAQSQEMICGGRYESGDDATRTFAGGTATNLTIEVSWRSGTRSVITNARPNRIYEISESGRAELPLSPAAQQRRPTNGETTTTIQTQFTDVSPLLNHIHTEEPFNDFARQPLLPRKLSQLGPGVSWFDVDGDSWDDLIIGSGKGGTLAVFRNDGKGGFTRLTDTPWAQPVTRDQTTVLGWRKPDGKTALLAGSANYENGSTEGSAVRSYDLEEKVVRDIIPGRPASTGPLALADVDGDGQLDLFIGGRVMAGRYPEAVSSQLLRGSGGQFAPDPENTKVLADLGLVSGAVFTDLDGDGRPDLVVACEWGPIKIFHNEKGKLREWEWKLSLNSQPSTLNQLPGWWNSVAVGDFGGDGRMDLVAGNWGRNTKYQSALRQPLRIYHGDLNGDGITEIVEAHHDPELNKIVPWRFWDQLTWALPFLREKFTGPDTYREASVTELLGERMSELKELTATTLDTMVFLNRGDHFEARPLPIEAQFAPVFGIGVADFDGDGREDIFLAQNFFAVDAETTRYDAGRGLLLKGDGRGGFSAVPGQESGLLIYGEQRGAAVCDYDGDGRVDLAVSQNAAATKLYRNTTAKPGLRVRLAGVAGNPAALGAVVRLGDGAGQFSPARELHAGSGYWSQDSAASVLSAPFTAKQIRVRWPGGKETTSEIPSGAKEIVVDTTGQVTAKR